MQRAREIFGMQNLHILGDLLWFNSSSSSARHATATGLLTLNVRRADAAWSKTTRVDIGVPVAWLSDYKLCLERSDEHELHL